MSRLLNWIVLPGCNCHGWSYKETRCTVVVSQAVAVFPAGWFQLDLLSIINKRTIKLLLYLLIQISTCGSRKSRQWEEDRVLGLAAFAHLLLDLVGISLSMMNLCLGTKEKDDTTLYDVLLDQKSTFKFTSLRLGYSKSEDGLWSWCHQGRKDRPELCSR